MHFTPEHRSMLSITWTDIDTMLTEFTDQVRREGLVEHHRCRRIARHFLAWLKMSDLAPGQVDATVISQFLQHDCQCVSEAPAAVRLSPWRKRRSSSDLIRLVRFLEQKKVIAVPGDLDSNLRLLERYLEQMRAAGYSHRTRRNCRATCVSLLIWLHFSRIRLCELTAGVLERFRQRQFICLIPGLYAGRAWCTSGRADWSGLRGFLSHLADTGMIRPLSPAVTDAPVPRRTDRFRTWLVRHRHLSADTVNRHTRLMTMLLEDLGEDAGIYSPTLIRSVLFAHMDGRSSDYAAKLAGTMRMYLRFLVAEGAVSEALTAAVPTAPKWSLSTLPKHIPAADIDRTISSCGDHPAGIRNRAVLLLLARLALRAGDIIALRIGDIDWNRAEIRVSGKSLRTTALPLPQDVGDALYRYITAARPRIDGLPLREQKVFLGSLAPYRPFCAASTVTSIVRRSLDRAGIITRGGRGAHVFRHSQATSLLRGGASFEVVSSLLRHASLNTTMIYAKVDSVMLQEIAQPWLGGGAA